MQTSILIKFSGKKSTNDDIAQNEKLNQQNFIRNENLEDFSFKHKNQIEHSVISQDSNPVVNIKPSAIEDSLSNSTMSSPQRISIKSVPDDLHKMDQNVDYCQSVFGLFDDSRCGPKKQEFRFQPMNIQQDIQYNPQYFNQIQTANFQSDSDYCQSIFADLNDQRCYQFDKKHKIDTKAIGNNMN